jgi:hypothetical protein
MALGTAVLVSSMSKDDVVFRARCRRDYMLKALARRQDKPRKHPVTSDTHVG